MLANPTGLTYILWYHTETKKYLLVCLLSEAQEVRANNLHYQEIPPRKRNHTSHDQFNSPKLIGKPLTQELTERKKNPSEGKPTPVQLSDYLGTSDPPLKPPSYRALSQSFFPWPIVRKNKLLLLLLSS